MNMISFKNRKFLIVLIIVGIAAFISGLLMPSISSRNIGLIGLVDPEPKLPPSEENRIYHPKGFSVISPDGWIAIIETNEDESRDQILIRPNINARWLPTLVISLNNERTTLLDPNEYYPDKYLEYDAMICEMLWGDYYDWHAFFSYKNSQYSVLLMLPHGHGPPRYEKVPDHWWPFIKSFRIDLK